MKRRKEKLKSSLRVYSLLLTTWEMNGNNIDDNFLTLTLQCRSPDRLNQSQDSTKGSELGVAGRYFQHKEN